jgi:hypothetical protein
VLFASEFEGAELHGRCSQCNSGIAKRWSPGRTVRNRLAWARNLHRRGARPRADLRGPRSRQRRRSRSRRKPDQATLLRWGDARPPARRHWKRPAGHCPGTFTRSVAFVVSPARGQTSTATDSCTPLADGKAGRGPRRRAEGVVGSVEVQSRALRRSGGPISFPDSDRCPFSPRKNVFCNSGGCHGKARRPRTACKLSRLGLPTP